jgi:hypothetical protein
MLSKRFYHRLALKLGRSVKELLATVDAAELVDWAAFYIHEPFGQEWSQTAKIAAVVAWSAGAKNVDERTFLPVYYEREMTEEQMAAELMKLGSLFQPAEKPEG